jgi:hypothetical protein|tara:strand:- start:271 stop:564 length:294 start_codon:yes stop_codon:yes gene_type:complete
MGMIDKTDLVLDAVLTNKGRDYLRKAVYGENQNGEHVITKFALSDDEIDYALWGNGTHNGDIIDNQPILEPNVNWRTPNDCEIMKYFLFKHGIVENV